MNVALDSNVAAIAPELPRQSADTDLTVTVFNAFGPPEAISVQLQQTQPDVIVVDSAWLTVAPFLESLVAVSGQHDAKRVVGARVVDDVLRIQSAHRGMFDVVDLTMPTPDLVARLHRIHGGTSALRRADLWRRVPRPAIVPDITTVPQDQIDLAILELTSIGYRDQDIAEALYYSVQAVKNRLGAMLRRSGLSNRTQLAWQFTNQVLTARMIQNMQHSEAVARVTATSRTPTPRA